MSPERSRDSGDDVREVRLEGGGLWVAAVVLIALLAVAFQAGRWFESRTAGSPGGGLSAPFAEGGAVESKVVSAEEGLTVFDTMEGKEAEPGREARPDPSPAVEVAGDAPGPGQADAVSDGAHFVQVFAGRERRSAESIVGRLKDQGYPVRVVSVREGRDTIFKVQVGGYPTREDAEPALARLRADGHAGAWIPPVEP